MKSALVSALGVPIAVRIPTIETWVASCVALRCLAECRGWDRLSVDWCASRTFRSCLDCRIVAGQSIQQAAQRRMPETAHVRNAQPAMPTPIPARTCVDHVRGTILVSRETRSRGVPCQTPVGRPHEIKGSRPDLERTGQRARVRPMRRDTADSERGTLCSATGRFWIAAGSIQTLQSRATRSCDGCPAS